MNKKELKAAIAESAKNVRRTIKTEVIEKLNRNAISENEKVVDMVLERELLEVKKCRNKLFHMITVITESDAKLYGVKYEMHFIERMHVNIKKFVHSLVEPKDVEFDEIITYIDFLNTQMYASLIILDFMKNILSVTDDVSDILVYETFKNDFEELTRFVAGYMNQINTIVENMNLPTDIQ